MVGGLFEEAGVGLAQRRLKVLEDGLLVGRLEVGEALEEVQEEVLDRFDREGAGHLAGLVAAHAVGDEEEVGAVAAVLRPRLRQAALADPERPGQFGNQEVVLVGRADLAAVGEAEAPHGEGGGRGSAAGSSGTVSGRSEAAEVMESSFRRGREGGRSSRRGGPVRVGGPNARTA